MADNYLQLRCKACGHLCILAKYYPIEWFVPSKVNMNEYLYSFFDHVNKCFLENFDDFENEGEIVELINDYSDYVFDLKNKKAHKKG